MDSEMYTQAISQTESSLVESEETQPVASTSSLPAPTAAVSQSSFDFAQSTVPGEVSTLESKMEDTSYDTLPSVSTSQQILPEPAPEDTYSSPFLNAQIATSAKPGAAPSQPVPPYFPRVAGPSEPQATGVVKVSAATKVITNAEKEKMKDTDLKDLGLVLGSHGQRKDIWLEEDVVKMSVAELKKQGLGRGMTGYCYSSRMTLHRPIPKTEPVNNPHPEQPSRIMGVFRRLGEYALLPRMERIAVREAVRDEILLVHSPGHWDRVRATEFQTLEFLEQNAEAFERLSLYVNGESAICARLSCGGVIEMCRAVAEGQIRNGFAIVRPPGHHAEPEEPMGFCFFNNAAVAAKWLTTVYDGTQSISSGSMLTGVNHSSGGGSSATNGKEGGTTSNGTGSSEVKIEKVLILDWDVHHGNGTQKAFWDDPNILYMSLHRHDGAFYPGGTYGGADMVGGGAGTGFSVNVPFPNAGMGDSDYIYAFQQVIMPIAYEFAPDFVIVSAGYDAAKGDELGHMQVTPEGFAHMTNLLSTLARGKLVLALEGGYNVEAIATSAQACVEVLLGDEPRAIKLGAASASACDTIQEVISVQSKYWKTMGIAQVSEPELRKAAKAIPIAQILKSHRTYELYHEYSLYNLAFSEPVLEEAYKDQLLCTSNVYSADTLVLFMHDLGNVKAVFSAHTLDLNIEKTLLLDASREVLDWAIKDNGYAVIDVNFLAHLPSAMGQAPDRIRDRAREKELALYLWDNIISLSSAQNIVLFGSGCGCSALMNIIQHRPIVRERVRACISVLGLEAPPELDSSSNIRPWFKENSLVMLPSTHTLHDDARKAGKHQKKYGNVHRASGDDEGRPIQTLRASFTKIKEFVAGRIPDVVIPSETRAVETEMVNGHAGPDDGMELS